MAALALYGITTIAWGWVLQKLELGRVYPLMAMAFVLVPLGVMLQMNLDLAPPPTMEFCGCGSNYDWNCSDGEGLEKLYEMFTNAMQDRPIVFTLSTTAQNVADGITIPSGVV